MATTTEATKEAGLQVPEGLSLPEKVIHSIQLSDAALTKAAAAEAEAEKTAAAVDALIPQVVDIMIQHERIQPNQKEKLAEMLKNPVHALELMMKVAVHKNKDELARLGSGVSHEKTASDNRHNPANSLSDPHVGAKTTRVKQSSVCLFEGLGLSAPTEE